jgi:hypothetical protein
MIRAWDRFARLGRCRPECHGSEAERRDQETSIAERRVSMTFPYLSVRFLSGEVSVDGVGQSEQQVSSRTLR